MPLPTRIDKSVRRWTEGQRVAVLTTRPIDGCLDYIVPEEGVEEGALVEVPLGPTVALGVVWGPGTGDIDASRLRRVRNLIEAVPLQGSFRSFLERLAEYTVTPLSAVLRLAIRAPGLARGRPRLSVYRRTGAKPERMTAARARVLAVFDELDGDALTLDEIVTRAAVGGSVVSGLVKLGVLVRETVMRHDAYPLMKGRPNELELSSHQQETADHLSRMVGSGEFSVTLLKGVTGSGKTEVYLEAAAECIRSGRQVLVLVPEIALTWQFIQRMTEKFGGTPGEWHSKITESERRRLWHCAAEGDVQLVIGARSALFLPFSNLGLIVVDEEHDVSYKQEDGVLYSARDMAVLRASLCGATVVLASATPSLETWNNARQGKYNRLDLPTRIGGSQMPEMVAIDMRETGIEPGNWISGVLAMGVREALDRRRQSLLFLNRRGYSPVTVCRTCGMQLGCDSCDARLVQHRFRNALMCHQCGESRQFPKLCPNCGEEESLVPLGPGVERLAEEALRLFAGARIEILSSDLIGSVNEMRDWIEFIKHGGADIVIGTQIVAKGHNFPLLDVVGAVDADFGLHCSDLRAAEKTFQLMTQVAGRTGRESGGERGIAFLQTWQPEHPVIRAILSGNDEEFMAAEAAEREVAGVPPFGRYAGILLTGPNESTVVEIAQTMARRIEPLSRIGAQVFGPAPAPISRIRGRSRYRLLIKADRGAPLQTALIQWRDQFRFPAGVRFTIDIDPQRFN